MIKHIICFVLLFGITISAPALAQNGFSLDFENPEIDAAPQSAPSSVGLFQNITIGGALDTRVLVPAGKKGRLGIHVNELFLTTNIGDNISILAEQLLLLSEQSSVVGQDHGFVYAVLSNYSFFPEGVSVKVGRFRAKWGYDARSDSPANPVQSLAIKSLGQITDLGVEVSGYIGDDLDYSIAILNGTDTLFVTTVDGNGNTIYVENPANNPRNSYYARMYYEVIPMMRFGISFFDGESYIWKNGLNFDSKTLQVFGALDRSQIRPKKRTSLDGSLKLGKLTLNGEYGFGIDELSVGRQDVKTYLVRADYNFISNRLSGLIQLDAINDGFSSTNDQIIASTAVSYNLTDESLMRLFYITGIDSIGDRYLAGVQLLLAF